MRIYHTHQNEQKLNDNVNELTSSKLCLQFARQNGFSFFLDIVGVGVGVVVVVRRS